VSEQMKQAKFGARVTTVADLKFMNLELGGLVE